VLPVRVRVLGPKCERTPPGKGLGPEPPSLSSGPRDVSLIGPRARFYAPTMQNATRWVAAFKQGRD